MNFADERPLEVVGRGLDVDSAISLVRTVGAVFSDAAIVLSEPAREAVEGAVLAECELLWEPATEADRWFDDGAADAAFVLSEPA
jgi:hypothetical protein